MSKKNYAERDIERQRFYMDHLEAMTAEGLHDKGAIAAELAHRDERIALLVQRLTQIDSIIFAEGAPLGGDRYFRIRELTSKTLRETEA